MRRILLSLLLLAALPFSASAQSLVGYFSLDSIVKSMPEYAEAQRNLADLRLKYDAEMRRAEEEFNAKYEEFLEGQRDFVPSILKKRQSELQDLMDKNVAFKKEAQRLLTQAETDAMGPIRDKVRKALQRVGKAAGYAVIINTDSDACPYIDPSVADNIAPQLRAALGI